MEEEEKDVVVEEEETVRVARRGDTHTQEILARINTHMLPHVYSHTHTHTHTRVS